MKSWIWFLVISIAFGTSYQATPPPYGYRIEWYSNMPIDHFSYTDNRTFDMRYLINDTYFKPDGPIFFYCGNEGGIETFAQNTGFMWDQAPNFNALILFAEHRYYGETQPFGKESYQSLKNLGYLSSEQALADYAVFLQWFKNVNYTATSNSLVIAFGGSYGGMLAAWMRIKYPHIIAGAVAASAPILQFTNVTDCGVFSSIVTRTFRNSGDQCDECIKKSWPAIRRLANTTEGQKALTSIFHLCPNSTIENPGNATALVNWLTDIYGNLAMVDYPYEANFLNPVPAWPVKATCAYLTNPDVSDQELVTAIYKAASVFMNYTGNQQCYTFNDADAALGVGAIGWDFQTCTEMVMPMCNNGTDMFEESKWNFTNFSDGCFNKLGVRPRENWATTNYGADHLAAASNIIFSNGDLDPWSGGGVLKSISDSVVSLFVKGGAHHYDLRGKHQNDTQWVKDVRRTEAGYIRKWLKPKKNYILKSETKRQLDPIIKWMCD